MAAGKGLKVKNMVKEQKKNKAKVLQNEIGGKTKTKKK